MIELFVGCVVFGAVGWVVLTIFQPFYTSMKAGWDADRDYAFDRWKRLQQLEAINARFKPIKEKEKESKEDESISRVRSDRSPSGKGQVNKTSKSSGKGHKHKPKRRAPGNSKGKGR